MEVIYMMTIIISVIALMVTLSILGEMDRRNKEAKEYERKVLENLSSIQYLNNEKIKITASMNEEIKAMKRVMEGEEYYE